MLVDAFLDRRSVDIIFTVTCAVVDRRRPQRGHEQDGLCELEDYESPTASRPSPKTKLEGRNPHRCRCPPT